MHKCHHQSTILFCFSSYLSWGKSGKHPAVSLDREQIRSVLVLSFPDLLMGPKQRCEQHRSVTGFMSENSSALPWWVVQRKEERRGKALKIETKIGKNLNYPIRRPDTSKKLSTNVTMTVWWHGLIPPSIETEIHTVQSVALSLNQSRKPPPLELKMKTSS